MAVDRKVEAGGILLTLRNTFHPHQAHTFRRMPISVGKCRSYSGGGGGVGIFGAIENTELIEKSRCTWNFGQLGQSSCAEDAVRTALTLPLRCRAGFTPCYSRYQASGLLPSCDFVLARQPESGLPNPVVAQAHVVDN